jgi:hypothetical protein
MKKILLTTAAIICIALSAQSQILNGGFENWTSGLPDNWWGAILPPYNLLSQTTTAHSGNYAVKLHIDTLVGQPFGTPLSTGNGNITTHPLSFVPHSVSFWYELNVVGGDELTLTALVYSGGTGSGVAAVAVPAAASYTNMIIPIQYGVVPSTADSIALIFVITNAISSAHFGSDAYIDDVSISASTGINNLQASNGYQITPNPASQFIAIKFPSQIIKPSSIFITDVLGNLIYNYEVPGGEKEFKISITNFKQGIYYCTIKSGEIEIRKPIVIINE